MTTGELLSIEPSNVEFLFESMKQLSCSLQLSNRTDDYVAFKFFTTNPKNYCVRPKNGVVNPHSTSNVEVIMQLQKEAPLGMKCKDKFLVKSVVTNPGSTSKDITMEMFNKEVGNNIEETKLRVGYVSSSSVGEVIVQNSSSDNESLYTPDKEEGKAWDLFFPPSVVRGGSEQGSFSRVLLSADGNLV